MVEGGSASTDDSTEVQLAPTLQAGWSWKSQVVLRPEWKTRGCQLGRNRQEKRLRETEREGGRGGGGRVERKGVRNRSKDYTKLQRRGGG